ncbi:hypothetical protein BDW68DRAFT_175689 [Aspergillus falconensis]
MFEDSLSDGVVVEGRDELEDEPEDEEEEEEEGGDADANGGFESADEDDEDELGGFGLALRGLPTGLFATFPPIIPPAAPLAGAGAHLAAATPRRPPRRPKPLHALFHALVHPHLLQPLQLQFQPNSHQLLPSAPSSASFFASFARIAAWRGVRGAGTGALLFFPAIFRLYTGEDKQ